MTPICLDHLSLYDVSALDLVAIAAATGCSAVSLFAQPLPLGPYLDLVEDRAARRQVADALRTAGLAVGIVEPFMLTEDTDWAGMERMAGLAAELGGTINALCFDAEPLRLTDSAGRLAAIARAAGARMAVEPFTLSTVRTVAEGLALATAAGPEVGLTIDTLHVIRTGGSWSDVAALPAARIYHVQLNDGPLQPPVSLRREATVARLPPGAGAFDLPALLPLIPDTARLAVEAPFVAPAGTTPLDRGRMLVEATRAVLQQAEAR